MIWKKYRIAKPKYPAKLGMVQKRICVFFWIDLAKTTLTSFNLVKDVEYDMDGFLRRFTLFICTLLGGSMLVAFFAAAIPMIHDYLQTVDVDKKWITLSVVAFFGLVGMAVYHLQQRKCTKPVDCEEGESLGFYKDED